MGDEGKVTARVFNKIEQGRLNRELLNRGFKNDGVSVNNSGTSSFLFLYSQVQNSFS